uniref:Putative C1q domain containing protein MgC1q39 n=1 Tax=Mytilus galloprovincialis TaxID=29158 RepID=F0V476_MYTGA|nr:putative C1q domain containing protein MgC1q39 [Mytilus galloprovincialis]
MFEMLVSLVFVCFATVYVYAESSCQSKEGGYDVTVNIRGEPSKEIPGVIAFHAYMSKSVIPRAGERLIFGVTKTNQGSGYNSKTGVFTCPKTGMYVFVWVIRVHQAEHSTELMINNSVYGSTFLRAKGRDDGSVSGTVVAHVSKGDTVYVRNHSAYAGDGRIHTNVHGKPTFSGWLLH